jgi:MoxR-like ATPase
MRGNDGSIYEVMETNSGVKRWKAADLSKPTVQRHVPYLDSDVTIVKQGSGIGDNHIGEKVKLKAFHPTHYSRNPGFLVHEPAPFNSNQGNRKGLYDGFMGADSFDLTKPPVYPTTTTPTYDQFDVEKLNQQISNIKQKTMSKKQSLPAKKTAQEVRTINTSLINKDEVFRMLALAEATGLPCLLVGEPGVAKTKTVIDYAKAWLNKDGTMAPQDFMNKIYMLETDEGTKASEIKGMPDLGKLFTNNVYELAAPIADAEIVIINEVDKASSAIRNAMLGVMNERFLFNGKHKIPCKWKLFIATCNEIPKEEADSPFWDRFMLKMTVNRVSAGEMVKYYKQGARSYKEVINVPVPTPQEIESVSIPVKKLEKYLEVGYTNSSDRTLTFVPKLAQAVSYIWDISVDKALVKTAQIMIGQTASSELQNKLMSPELKAIMSKVDMLHSQTTNEQLELAIAEIEALINSYTSRGILDSDQVQEVELSMQYILSSHPARKDYQSAEEFDNILEEAVATPDATNPF